MRTSCFLRFSYKGFSISVNDSGEVLIDKDFHDEIGHGTAVFYLIKTT